MKARNAMSRADGVSRSLSALAVVGAIAVSFCGIPVARATDGTTNSVAVYAVPVTDQSLAIYAQFFIPTVTTTVAGQQISFSYPLPPELVGATPLTVSLSGTIVPGQPLQISGDRGTGVCTLSVDHQSAVCQIRYRNLAIDPNAVNAYLSSKVTDPNELQSREQVASFFGAEPVGIVTYPLSP